MSLINDAIFAGHSASKSILTDSDVIENKLNYLNMESQIAIFKGKLLKLQHEALLVLNDKDLDIETKEKSTDESIEKGKQLMLELISFIFNNPLKEKEFIIKVENNDVTFYGHLAYIFNYFATDYGINIKNDMEKYISRNQSEAILDGKMSLEVFINTFDKYYYQVNNDDNLL